MSLDLAPAVDNATADLDPLSVTEGIFYLDELDLKLTLLALYQQMFPQQWAASPTSLLQQSPKNTYSDRELEFLDLVNRQLFPLDLLEDYRGIPERLDSVPVCSLNPSWYWYEIGIDEFSYSQQLVLSLLGHGYPREEWQPNFGFTPAILLNGHQIDWELLATLSQSAAAPLSYLFDVATIFDHSTGSTWLDIYEESYEHFAWEQETIERLAQDWQVAQALLAKLEQFEAWVKDSIENGQKIVDLWNQAASKQTNQPSILGKSLLW